MYNDGRRSMMTSIEEYHNGAGHYEFPDGTKVRGKEAAEQYQADLDEFDAAAEEAAAEEAAAVEEAAEDEVVEEEAVVEDTPKAAVSQTSEKEFLMQMTRPANLFEIVGPSGRLYKFGKGREILVVRSEDVEEILGQGGFRLVSPEIAKEYYS